MNNQKEKIVLTSLLIVLLSISFAECSEPRFHLSAHSRGNKNGFFLGGEIGSHFPTEVCNIVPYLSFSITPYSKTTLLHTGPAEYYQLEQVHTMFDLGSRQEFYLGSQARFYVQAGLGVDGGYYKGTKRDMETVALFQSEAGFAFTLGQSSEGFSLLCGGGIRANADIQYPSFSLSLSLGF